MVLARYREQVRAVRALSNHAKDPEAKFGRIGQSSAELTSAAEQGLRICGRASATGRALEAFEPQHAHQLEQLQRPGASAGGAPLNPSRVLVGSTSLLV